jgi:hypothetical protein
MSGRDLPGPRDSSGRLILLCPIVQMRRLRAREVPLLCFGTTSIQNPSKDPHRFPFWTAGIGTIEEHRKSSPCSGQSPCGSCSLWPKCLCSEDCLAPPSSRAPGLTATSVPIGQLPFPVLWAWQGPTGVELYPQVPELPLPLSAQGHRAPFVPQWGPGRCQ